MSWTDERIALLKKLWADGRTAAEIAKAIGGEVTRNASGRQAEGFGLGTEASLDLFEATFGKEEEVESAKNNHGEEVETIDIRMAEGTEDTEDRNIFVEEADVEYELVETKDYWENTREKECLEEILEVTGGLYGGIGKKSEGKKIKKS